MSDLTGNLERVIAASGFVAEAASREPALIAELAASGELARARRTGEIREIAMALLEAGDDDAGFMDRLRRLRRDRKSVV